MKLLILGGTIFVGRALVEAAQARGYEVTLFNRGQHNPELFPDVERLRGDRDGGLDALRGRSWDAVVDTCGYVPRIVRQSAELLADVVGHYSFISSISVYSEFSKRGIDETDPVGTLEDETEETVTGETYGPLKALCEQAAERELPGRVLNVRAGLIVGPYDLSDRFTYWPVRIERGGEVLAPGRPNAGCQFIDVRDLVDWNLRMIEAGVTGVYNVTGPDQPLTLQTVLETCRAVSNSDASFMWVDDAFLKEREVAPWSELPLYVGESPEFAGFDAVDCSRAMQASLTFRPLADTVRATLEWEAARPADHPWRAGLTAERETEILRAWQENRSTSTQDQHLTPNT
jgi:2'-hydroxyisoflavone reductase